MFFSATVSVFTANFVKELKIVGAEVERERRAQVIAAEGEYQAAQRLADAAAIMTKEPIALQLRFRRPSWKSLRRTTRRPSSRCRSTF